jgi:hypothetical protein
MRACPTLSFVMAGRMLLVASSLFALSACASVSSGQQTRQSAAPRAAEEQSTAASPAVPGWAEKCLPPVSARLGPVPEYVGGGDRCGGLPRLDVLGPSPSDPVFILLDRALSPDGQVSESTRQEAVIVAAVRIDPKWLGERWND